MMPGRPDRLGDWFMNTLVAARSAELADRETVANLLMDVHTYLADQAEEWLPSDERDE
jgi:hypothetical protein